MARYLIFFQYIGTKYRWAVVKFNWVVYNVVVTAKWHSIEDVTFLLFFFIIYLFFFLFLQRSSKGPCDSAEQEGSPEPPGSEFNSLKR